MKNKCAVIFYGSAMVLVLCFFLATKTNVWMISAVCFSPIALATGFGCGIFDGWNIRRVRASLEFE